MQACHQQLRPNHQAVRQERRKSAVLVGADREFNKAVGIFTSIDRRHVPTTMFISGQGFLVVTREERETAIVG